MRRLAARCNFARAVLANGHAIHRVFFYHAGVNLANALTVAPQDEIDAGRDWAAFATDHGIELAVCVAAALRRGVLSEGESQRYERAGVESADAVTRSSDSGN